MTYNVAILGASSNPERYSCLAQRMLTDRGYRVLPVALNQAEINGVPAYQTLAEIPEPVDTVTVYLSPQRVEAALPDILAARPRRAIFNPGSESATAMSTLAEQGIDVVQACSLVLLRTGQFDD